MRKGQVASMDVVVGLVIFLLAVTVTFLSLRTYNLNAENEDEFTNAQLQAHNIADLLVTQQGIPSDWENAPATVEVFGLAASYHVLSPAKVSAFVNAENVTSVLNIAPSKYHFKLEHENGSLIAQAGNMSGFDSAASTQHLVKYNNETATVTFQIRN